MNYRLLNLVGSLAILATTVVLFFWLWSGTRGIQNTFVVPENLKPVEIRSLKSESSLLIGDLENNANIPLATPIDKMGRSNPFDPTE
ncbi:MAG: hypothetical protein WCT32_04035 [Patescibacteria group bacterium]|jgi:hypothetical protein